MPGIIVVGSQWGDEGKGKVVDVFSAQADFVVRYQGGANAGHTLVVDGKTTVLHLVPSGVLHPKTTCIVAAGVVLDVEAVTHEIRALKKAGLLDNPKQLMISESCTMLLPYHRMLDGARENSLGHEKIGTTGKGIGPAYEDRASRRAVLFGDLFQKDRLREKLELSLREKNFLLERFYKLEPVSIDKLIHDLEEFAEELEPYRCRDTSLVVHKALRAGKKILFEGAQGTLLDLLHGTYPFVTSSSTLAGSACIGSGIGPSAVQKVVGITKAYTTRVGSGPFPTELKNEIGQKIQTDGREFGATTGRPRRCGWLDLVALRYAIRINGITNLALMKLDVLSGHDEIGVCTDYMLRGEKIREFPTSSRELAEVEPVIQRLPGWDQDITQARSVKDLPHTTQQYIHFIGSELGTPIDVISVGPGREQTLWIKPLFA